MKFFLSHLASLLLGRQRERRNEGDAQGAEELQDSIEMVSKTKGNVWIPGDFYYPNFFWGADHVPSIKPGCSYPNLYDDFMTMLDDFSLV